MRNLLRAGRGGKPSRAKKPPRVSSEPDAALQRGEDVLGVVIETTSALIAYLDPDFNFVRVNSAFVRSSGHTAEELTGKNHFAFFPNPDNQAIFEKVRDTGEPVEYKAKPFVYFDQPERGITYWDWTLSPVKNASGRIQGFVLSLVDVTATTLQLRALEQSEKKFRDLYENAPIAYFSVGVDGRIQNCNRKAAKLLGYSRDDLAGQPVLDLYGDNPEGKEKAREMFKRFGAGEEISDEELQMRRADGRPVHIRLSVTPIRDSSGRVVASRSMVVDLTEQKRAEDKIRNQDVLLRRVIDAIRDPFYVIDAKDYTIKMANAAARFGRLPGVTTCYALRRGSAKPCGGEQHVCPLQQVKETKRPVVVEHNHTDEDGATRVFEIHCHPIFDAEGNVKEAIEYSIDVTERKGAEDALRNRTRDLDNRLKEINCLYSLSNLVDTPDISLVQILRGTVELIPPAWQYPEVTCARIVLDGQVFQTDNWVATDWRQSGDIVVRGDPVGTIEICYLEERPESDEGPFVREERDLLKAITQRLARVVERMRADETLRQSEAVSRSLVEAIPDMMFRVRGDGTFVAFVAADGVEPFVPPSEFIGKRVHQVLPPKVARESMRCIETALQNRNPQQFEYQLEIFGEDRYYEARFVAIAPDEVLAIVRELTAQKSAEQAEALRKAREELEGKVEREMMTRNPYGLTFRELTVLHLMAVGAADKAIAEQLDVSKYTVNKHVANILNKMGAASRTEACVRAYREGFIT